MGRENAGRAAWEVLKPPTPLQVYSEHRSGLGRQRVLGKKKYSERRIARQGWCALTFCMLAEPPVVRWKKCRSSTL